MRMTIEIRVAAALQFCEQQIRVATFGDVVKLAKLALYAQRRTCSALPSRGGGAVTAAPSGRRHQRKRHQNAQGVPSGRPSTS